MTRKKQECLQDCKTGVNAFRHVGCMNTIILWLMIMIPCSALITGIGIFAWRRIISETSFQPGFPSPLVSSLKIQGFPNAPLPIITPSTPVV